MNNEIAEQKSEVDKILLRLESFLCKKVELAGFDPNQPRNKNGEWGGSSWYKTDLKEQLYEHSKEGGSTFTTDGENQAGAKGMGSVAVFPSRSMTIKDILTEDILNDYMELNKDVLSGNNYAIGTWYDSKTGLTWLDIILVTDLENAIKLGIENNQIAIFDLEIMDEVLTGGDGQKTK